MLWLENQLKCEERAAIFLKLDEVYESGNPCVIAGKAKCIAIRQLLPASRLLEKFLNLIHSLLHLLWILNEAGKWFLFG